MERVDRNGVQIMQFVALRPSKMGMPDTQHAAFDFLKRMGSQTPKWQFSHPAKTAEKKILRVVAPQKRVFLTTGTLALLQWEIPNAIHSMNALNVSNPSIFVQSGHC